VIAIPALAIFALVIPRVTARFVCYVIKT